MHRRELIQDILDRQGRGTYLEIGVRRGRTFLPVRARRKIAVDPEFLISIKERVYWSVRNPCNLWAGFLEMESDHFFFERAERTRSHRIDVALVDGLHLFEQALRDVVNTLRILGENGVIVVHDCNPSDAPSATRARTALEAVSINRRFNSWSGAWNGDVWKTIVYLRRHHPDLSVFVLDCDYGLGVITGTMREGFAVDQKGIENLRVQPYEYLASDRQKLLNLKPETFAKEFLQQL